ncbi:MAG: hypothetical protein U1F29_09605 [Planctomycetota bacterium]
MKLLPLLALALVPALVHAAPIVPAEPVLERLALRERTAALLEGVWHLDVERTEALPAARASAAKLVFRRDPLVVLLARTANARMAALPIFDGGIAYDGREHLPYVLVDRGGAIELLVFRPGEGTAFAAADALPVHVVATADGPRLYLGGEDARRAYGAYGPAAPELVPAPIVTGVERAADARPAAPGFE